MGEEKNVDNMSIGLKLRTRRGSPFGSHQLGHVATEHPGKCTNLFCAHSQLCYQRRKDFDGNTSSTGEEARMEHRNHFFA